MNLDRRRTAIARGYLLSGDKRDLRIAIYMICPEYYDQFIAAERTVRRARWIIAALLPATIGCAIASLLGAVTVSLIIEVPCTVTMAGLMIFAGERYRRAVKRVAVAAEQLGMGVALSDG